MSLQKNLQFSHRLLLIAILLLGAWLRIDALTEDTRFHPDEALFATFARDAAVHGQWMFPGALDKPPLSLYTAALSMHAVGVFVNDSGVLDLDLRVGEFVARLPAALAGIVSIALVYALSWSLIQRRDAALLAALLLALSPFHAAFSAAAFTDSLMLTFGLASLVLAARGRPLWAGVWLALSVWSKQQGIFLLLLVVWLTVEHVGTGYSASADGQPSHTMRTPYRMSLPIVSTLMTFLVGVGLLVAWDAARSTSQSATSLFALAAANNNPERTLVRPDEVLPRLSVWGSTLSTFFGAPLLTFVLMLIGVTGVSRRMWRRLAPLAGYGMLYLLAHWLIAFNLYDRYLLPLVPLLAVLVGVGLAGWVSNIQFLLHKITTTRPATTRRSTIRILSEKKWSTIVGTESALSAAQIFGQRRRCPYNIFAAFRWATRMPPLRFGREARLGRGMMQHAPTEDSVFHGVMAGGRRGCLLVVVGVLAGMLMWSAYPARYPTDDRARDEAILDLAAHLNSKTLGAILYDPWLGWELGYYLGAWSDKRRVHYPAPQSLADDALLNPDRAPRYFIAPRKRDITEWLGALEDNGFQIALDWENARYIVFRVLPPESVQRSGD